MIDELLDYVKKYFIFEIDNISITYNGTKQSTVSGTYETFEIVRKVGD